MNKTPGIYYRVPFEEYAAWEAVNNSSLGPALRSRRHYTHSLATGREDTSAFRFGRLTHECNFEASSVLGKYVVLPDLTEGILTASGNPAKSPKSTAEYRARVGRWRSVNVTDGVTVISSDELRDLRGVMDAVHRTDTARHWLVNHDGPNEVCIVWDDALTGIRCKGRVDKVAGSLLVDLKTTSDCADFERSMLRYGYLRQAAFYLDGWRSCGRSADGFGIVAVEKSAPWGCRAALLSSGAIEHGRQQYRQALAVVDGVECDYPAQEYFELPAYLSSLKETGV